MMMRDSTMHARYLWVLWVNGFQEYCTSAHSLNRSYDLIDMIMSIGTKRAARATTAYHMESDCN